MKIRHLMAVMAIASMGALALSSCGGGSDKASDSKFFGDVPGLYLQMMEKKDALKQQFKTASTEEEGRKLMAEAEKAEQDYGATLEEAAKALDGNTLEVQSTPQFTVKSPMTITFDGFASKLDQTPRFRVAGEIEAAENYQSDAARSLSGQNASSYAGLGEHVYLVGTDAGGNRVFSQKVAVVPLSVYSSDQLGVKAGTPLKLEDIVINKHNAEGCTKAVALHLSYKAE